MEIERKKRSLFWHRFLLPAWKWFIAGPPWIYGWFAFIRDEFFPSKIRDSWRVGGVFDMIAWYWWVIISLSALFVITVIVKSKPKSIAAVNQKVWGAPPNVSLLKSIGKLKCVPVIYENRNMWGDHMATYAAIRIDNRSNYHDLVARLVKVNRNNLDVNIDSINPTGNNLRWRQEGNRCILQVVAESNDTAVFIFENRRESCPLVEGEYVIEIVIYESAGSKTKQIKIVKNLRVNKPYHFLNKHETGLDWQ